MLTGNAKKWWRDRFVTVMLIPERTRRVHKLVIPFVMLKLGGILFSLSAVFFIIISIDYVHVLGRMAENKSLKGENFKLRQELQLIRNKVDSMETTIDRVRNYAKKLQLLTGQEGKESSQPSDVQLGPVEGNTSGVDIERRPATKRRKRNAAPVRSPETEAEPPSASAMPEVPLDPERETAGALSGRSVDIALSDRVDRLQRVSLLTETDLTMLQAYFLAQSAFLAATPTLLPIAGYIGSTFGYRRNPWDGSFRLHAGIDIAGEAGTPVRAPAVGTVIFSGQREGYGKCVVIDHGYGIRTLFAHNSQLFVTQGDLVRRGARSPK